MSQLAVLKSMILALLATASLCRAVPAAAQGGASCLYQCDAQCYGHAGPYCRSGCLARCPASPRPPEFYGSVYATSDGSGVYGFSYGKNNQYDAMAEAKSHARREAGRARGCSSLSIGALRSRMRSAPGGLLTSLARPNRAKPPPPATHCSYAREKIRAQAVRLRGSIARRRNHRMGCGAACVDIRIPHATSIY